jgi:hypothetical protein
MARAGIEHEVKVRPRWTRAFALSLFCVMSAGCRGEGAGRPASGPDDTPVQATDSAAVAPARADSTNWTVGRLSAAPTLDGGPPPLPVLSALRTGRHEEYERLTIEMEASGGLPGYRLEYVDRPLHECGSGREIFPVGDAWLELRMEPAAAHTEAGAPTLGEREVAVDAPLLRRIYRTCDFEGVVTLVLALSAPNAFRVTTLSAPPRLVVDVRR